MINKIIVGLILVFSSIYNDINPETSNPNYKSLYPVIINQKFGFIDKNGQLIIKPKFDKAGYFSENLAPILIENKFGYINERGNLIFNSDFDNIGYFKRGIAPVIKENRLLFIDKSNKVVFNSNFKVDKKYNEIIKEYNKKIVNMLSKDKYGFISNNFRNEEIIRLSLTTAFPNLFTESEKLIPIRENGKCGYKLGYKFVIPPIFDSCQYFSEGLAGIKINNKFGFINEKGKIVIEPNYSLVTEFENGFSKVFSKKYEIGLINKKGEMIIKPYYFELSTFSGTLALVKVTGKGYGFINKESKFIIEPKYKNAENFIGNLAQVETDEKYAYINKSGEIIWEISKEEKELVKSNMKKLFIMIDIFYINNKTCPKNFDELFEDSKKNNYFKNIENPYTKSSSLEENFMIFSDYNKLTNKSLIKGVLLFDFNIKQNLCGNVYATDSKGDLITNYDEILSYEVSF